jgi:alpha-D-ribose 1-methylphosphonate 5-triphosphate diphosphatase PhnM
MESRLGALCIAVFLSWNASQADAQGLHLIPGVAEIATDTIDDIAIATVDQPQPAIYYNPIRARRYGPTSTATSRCTTPVPA